jgi:hypothetical protein
MGIYRMRFDVLKALSIQVTGLQGPGKYGIVLPASFSTESLKSAGHQYDGALFLLSIVKAYQMYSCTFPLQVRKCTRDVTSLTCYPSTFSVNAVIEDQNQSNGVRIT